jgi:hypothetical protein
MEPFTLSTKTLLDGGRINSLFEAIWYYVVMVGAVTLLSLLTGSFLGWVLEPERGILLMRLINSFIAGVLAIRIVRAKHMGKRGAFATAIAMACSIPGYEIIGLVIPAYLTTLPLSEKNT